MISNNREKAIKVPSIDFPANAKTNAQKDSPDFGLQIGQSIQYEWFRKTGGDSCRYYDRWVDFHVRRLYARGEQSVEKYKNELAIEGDRSKLNIDWTPLPVAPKFCDILVNGMNERMFTPKAEAIDASSSDRKNEYQLQLEKDMVSKDFLEATAKNFGINAFSTDPSSLPENDQELELHMQMEFKPKIEIAAETAISNILEYNDFEIVKKEFLTDQVEVGVGIFHHTYYHGEGIKVRRVIPEHTVHSYTEDPYFRDVTYWGEVLRIPIVDLKKIKPDITTEEIDRIRKVGSSWFSEYSVVRPYVDDYFDSDVVSVLFFNYKTDRKTVYKKKQTKRGGYRVRKRDESFNPPEDNEMFSKIERTEDVWYDGVLVLGTEILLKWDLCENMVKPDSVFKKASSNYIAVAPKMYKGRIESPVSRIIPFVDLIQMTHYKFQQVLQRMVPDGLYIDVDGLSNINLGNGQKYSPNEAVKMYYATGSVFGRSMTEDGEYNHGKVPIQPLTNNVGISKLSTLADVYNHNMSMIRDVLGLNKSSDASTPDPRSLVGLSKLAALNSNTATRHILESMLYASKKLCECISTRVSDILKFSDESEEFANQIGKYNMNILEFIKNLHLHSFGIYMEVSPDEEAKAELQAQINEAIKSKSIELEDSIDINQIKNPKLANEMIKLRRKQKYRRDREAKEFEMQAQEASNIRSAQAAAEAKMSQVQAEAQAKIALSDREAENKIKVLAAEADLKKVLMDKEFEFNMSLRQADSELVLNKETMKEDRKDERVDKQSTQQSKMIRQRQLGTPPTNFESREDTLDGIGHSEFGPK